ncbi:fatty acid desaturase [Hyphococcus flavus]|uniref:Fatty acid desaturase n=1 Tax=Hyphococcus flavus TaxID=1866326 RepID=A0AAF0CC65_9PROT|nr:fatty acid desaturase [Hyphococcus flavus]WDI32725.1 fatty acid desaturase [Hyphococcus flavus]
MSETAQPFEPQTKPVAEGALAPEVVRLPLRDHSGDDVPLTISNTIAWPLVGLFFGLWAGLIGVSWAAVTGVIPVWAGTFLNFGLFYVLSDFNHEATHRNISGARSEWKWFNDALGQIGSFPFFLPFAAFKAVHLAHHRMTNHPTLDGDMWFAGKNFFDILGRAAGLLVGYEIILHRLAKQGFVTRKTIISIWVQRLAILGIIAAAFALGIGYEVFMLWTLPCLMVMIALGFLAYAVHCPHESREKYQNTNIWFGRGLMQPLIVAAMVNQNYHLVHHLHPRIPFYRYGRAFKQLRPELERNKATIRRL